MFEENWIKIVIFLAINWSQYWKSENVKQISARRSPPWPIYTVHKAATPLSGAAKTRAQNPKHQHIYLHTSLEWVRLQSDARVSLINQLAELCIAWIIIGVHRAMHKDAKRKYEAPMAERKGPRDRSLPLLNWHGAYPDARHASKTLIPAHSHFGLGTNHTTSCF